MNDEVEREEIEKLLPWYVTGRLERTDVGRIEDYLRRHPDMMPQLDQIRAERRETVRANEAIGVPRAGMDEDVLASLPLVRPRRAQSRRRPSVGRFLDRLPGMPTAGRLQWAALVALILTQSAVITGLLVFGGGATYRVAAGPSAGDHLSALVAFADEAKAAAMARLLTEFDATIVDGPKPGGVYKIMMRSRDNSRAAQQELLDRLAARRDVIRIVLPSGD
jgi:anti-sigma factor RsiW